jgi:hypothetical protein
MYYLSQSIKIARADRRALRRATAAGRCLVVAGWPWNKKPTEVGIQKGDWKSVQERRLYLAFNLLPLFAEIGDFTLAFQHQA